MSFLENGSDSVASTADDGKVVVVVCETTEKVPNRATPEDALVSVLEFWRGVTRTISSVSCLTSAWLHKDAVIRLLL